MHQEQQEILLENTKKIISKIFNFSNVEISLNQDKSNFIQVIPNSIQIPLDLFEPEIGMITIQGIMFENLEIEGRELLELIASNLATQLRALATQTQLEKELADHQESLRLANQELTIAYEDLNLAHEELSEAHNLAFLINRSFSRSKLRIKSFLDQAPIAFAILKHRHLKIEVANPLILSLWGKDSRIIGKPIATAIPELHGQPYLEILDKVYTTGERYIGKEAAAVIERNGKMTTDYFNFIYEPISNELGKTNAIMVIAIDVTEVINSRLISG